MIYEAEQLRQIREARAPHSRVMFSMGRKSTFHRYCIGKHLEVVGSWRSLLWTQSSYFIVVWSSKEVSFRT